MLGFVSRPVPEGHLVVVTADDDTQLLVSFPDDGSERDFTSWIADLALIGLAAGNEPAPERPDIVEVAKVRILGPAEALYIHHPSGSLSALSAEDLGRYVAAGAVRALTVMTEVAAAEAAGELAPTDDLTVDIADDLTTD